MPGTRAKAPVFGGSKRAGPPSGHVRIAAPLQLPAAQQRRASVAYRAQEGDLRRKQSKRGLALGVVPKQALAGVLVVVSLLLFGADASGLAWPATDAAAAAVGAVTIALAATAFALYFLHNLHPRLVRVIWATHAGVVLALMCGLRLAVEAAPSGSDPLQPGAALQGWALAVGQVLATVAVVALDAQVVRSRRATLLALALASAPHAVSFGYLTFVPRDWTPVRVLGRALVFREGVVRSMNAQTLMFAAKAIVHLATDPDCRRMMHVTAPQPYPAVARARTHVAATASRHAQRTAEDVAVVNVLSQVTSARAVAEDDPVSDPEDAKRPRSRSRPSRAAQASTQPAVDEVFLPVEIAERFYTARMTPRFKALTAFASVSAATFILSHFLTWNSPPYFATVAALGVSALLIPVTMFADNLSFVQVRSVCRQVTVLSLCGALIVNTLIDVLDPLHASTPFMTVAFMCVIVSVFFLDAARRALLPGPLRAVLMTLLTAIFAFNLFTYIFWREERLLFRFATARVYRSSLKRSLSFFMLSVVARGFLVALRDSSGTHMVFHERHARVSHLAHLCTPLHLPAPLVWLYPKRMLRTMRRARQQSTSTSTSSESLQSQTSGEEVVA